MNANNKRLGMLGLATLLVAAGMSGSTHAAREMTVAAAKSLVLDRLVEAENPSQRYARAENPPELHAEAENPSDRTARA